jgi:hypothetical protein
MKLLMEEGGQSFKSLVYAKVDSGLSSIFNTVAELD